MALTKAQMAERLYEEVGLNKREAKEFVDAFFEVLREALQRTGRIGIARVVIRTREHLCAVMPQGSALMLMMMRMS